MSPDLINGLFEIGGAFALLLNIQSLINDRRLAGVHWAPTVFFTTWSLWNLFYYPHLDQWFSLIGACAIVLVNAVWLALVLFYRRPR